MSAVATSARRDLRWLAFGLAPRRRLCGGDAGLEYRRMRSAADLSALRVVVLARLARGVGHPAPMVAILEVVVRRLQGEVHMAARAQGLRVCRLVEHCLLHVERGGGLAAGLLEPGIAVTHHAARLPAVGSVHCRLYVRLASLEALEGVAAHATPGSENNAAATTSAMVAQAFTSGADLLYACSAEAYDGAGS